MRAFRSKIRYKLFLAYTLPVLVLLFAFLVVTFLTASENARESYLQYRAALSRQTLSTIEDSVEWLDRQSSVVYADQHSLEMLMAGSQKLGYYEARISMMNLMSMQLLTSDTVDGIALLGTDGVAEFQWNRGNNTTNVYSSAEDGWYLETVALGGKGLLRANHVNLFSQDRQPVVSVSRALYSFNGKKRIGAVVAYQYLTRYAAYFEDLGLGEGERIALTDADGATVYGTAPDSGEAVFVSAQDGYELVDVDGERCLRLTVTSAALGWSIVSTTPVAVIDSAHPLASNMNLLLAGALIVVSFLLSTLLAVSITRPLGQFARSFQLVEQGNFDAPVEIRGRDELSAIGQSYNEMLRQTRALIRERYELKLAKTQSELEALQSQIRPHFLFNTLNSIKAVVDAGDDAQAAKMIQALSDLLRYTLGQGHSLVPLSEELESVRRYLYLQQCRFGDRYTVRYDIDPAALRLAIPRLTLQPLIENAIQHGLEPSSEPSQLILTARVAGARCVVYVSNTGKAFDEARLAELNARLAASTPDAALGFERIGVLNVHHRLQLHFGEGNGLRITSANGMTTVRFELPLTPPDEPNRKGGDAGCGS